MGELQVLLDQGVRGVPSNPTLFEQAIAGSTDYDDAMGWFVAGNAMAGEIYEVLVLDDIARAADVLRPLYDATDGADGYLSLEVSSTLAYDTLGTVAEAKRLYSALSRPNVMIMRSDVWHAC